MPLIESLTDLGEKSRPGDDGPIRPGGPESFIRISGMEKARPPSAAAIASTDPRLWELLRCLYDRDAEKAGEVLPSVTASLAGELARRRLAPWVYWKTAGLGWERNLAPPILEFLRREYAAALLEGNREKEEVLQVLQALAEVRVEAVLLKGADLRLRLYRDWAVRPMVDIDLLVAPEEFARAREALVRLGYRSRHPRPRRNFFERFEHEELLAPPTGGLKGVDLHREIRAVAGFYRLPFSFCREETLKVPFRGAALRVLRPEMLLVHLCLHAFDDRYVYGTGDDPRQLLDIGLALRRFPPDWPTLRRLAAEAAVFWPVAQVLLRVHHRLPGCLPPEVLSRLQDSRPHPLERLILNKALGYLTNYLPLFLHHSPKEWLFFLAAKIWPDPDYIAAETPDSSRPSYFARFFRKLFP